MGNGIVVVKLEECYKINSTKTIYLDHLQLCLYREKSVKKTKKKMINGGIAQNYSELLVVSKVEKGSSPIKKWESYTTSK